MMVCWQPCSQCSVLNNPLVRNKHSDPVLQPLSFKQIFFSCELYFLKTGKKKKITPWKRIQKWVCWGIEDVLRSTLERTICSEKTVASDLENACSSWEMKCAVTFSHAFTTALLWFWVVSPCQHKSHHLGTKAWRY